MPTIAVLWERAHARLYVRAEPRVGPTHSRTPVAAVAGICSSTCSSDSPDDDRNLVWCAVHAACCREHFARRILHGARCTRVMSHVHTLHMLHMGSMQPHSSRAQYPTMIAILFTLFSTYTDEPHDVWARAFARACGRISRGHIFRARGHARACLRGV